jgi:hypothetical protein
MPDSAFARPQTFPVVYLLNKSLRSFVEIFTLLISFDILVIRLSRGRIFIV